MNSLTALIRNKPFLALSICFLITGGLVKAWHFFGLQPFSTELKNSVEIFEKKQRLARSQLPASAMDHNHALDVLLPKDESTKLQPELDRLAKLFSIKIIQQESVVKKSEAIGVRAADYTLAVQGSYIGIRGWLTAILNSHSNIALRSLSIKRVGDDAAPLQSQLQLTWYEREK